ncbi:MAG: hypothetical protein C4310_01750 [Chloroflexota bacterium]
MLKRSCGYVPLATRLFPLCGHGRSFNVKLPGMEVQPMPNSVHGIHHITAIAGHAQQNLDFYVEVLGMRLVKKTVNQDVPDTYHLFYADRVGTPGTDLTFFIWPEMEPARLGVGFTVEVLLAVPVGSLVYWRKRLEKNRVAFGEVETRFGEPVLPFQDPNGCGWPWWRRAMSASLSPGRIAPFPRSTRCAAFTRPGCGSATSSGQRRSSPRSWALNTSAARMAGSVMALKVAHPVRGLRSRRCRMSAMATGGSGASITWPGG